MNSTEIRINQLDRQQKIDNLIKMAESAVKTYQLLLDAVTQLSEPENVSSAKEGINAALNHLFKIQCELSKLGCSYIIEL